MFFSRSVFFSSFMLFLLLTVVEGCRATWPPPELAGLDTDEAGGVVRLALHSQGYLGWRGEKGLVFDLRSRTGGRGKRLITKEEVRMDLPNPRIEVRTSAEAGDGEVRVCDGEHYWALRAGRPVRDPETLVEGRLRTCRDCFITLLPFALARWPAELALLPEAKLGTGRYRVVSVRFRRKGMFPPDSEYTLYFRTTMSAMLNLIITN